ncbi:unnamed protein product, partial [Didymodactylos carnosus]
MAASNAASAPLQNRERHSMPLEKIKYVNLEPFSLVWLDSEVNKTPENHKLQIRLREIIHWLKTFSNVNKCEEYIREQTDEAIVLIVNGRLGQELVPRIHDLPQISCIYIFCMDKHANKIWAHNYKNVRAVINQSDKLLYKLAKHQFKRERADEQLTMSLYNGGEHLTLKIGQNLTFVWVQLLTDVLLNVKQNRQWGIRDLV